MSDGLVKERVFHDWLLDNLDSLGFDFGELIKGLPRQFTRKNKSFKNDMDKTIFLS